MLKLNEIQVIGSHNSYHIQPNPNLLQVLCSRNSQARSLAYSHQPLPEQLQLQNIRQIELDIYADPQGGRFAQRVGLALLGQSPESGIPALDEPGLKVMHIPHIDYETTCLTLVEGLTLVRNWSLSNPRHLPVMLLIEVKGSLPSEISELLRAKCPSCSLPIECTEEHMDALDQEIRSVFATSHLITPDEVRGDYGTLEQAVLDKGWPTLESSRGRILFTLDNTDHIRDIYRQDRDSLEGRILFASGQPGEPWTAFIKHNDPTGSNMHEIQSLVKAGYLVRTMSDPHMDDIQEGLVGRKDAALQSGAQFVSTDYPAPGKWGYSVSLPGAEHAPGRINPVNGPAVAYGALDES